MVGGELGQSMDQLRQSAASGEGQMRATIDLAREMGSGVARQQEVRKARGKMLFDEYKKKMNLVQPRPSNPPHLLPNARRSPRVAALFLPLCLGPALAESSGGVQRCVTPVNNVECGGTNQSHVLRHRVSESRR
jgi:hypothetical protein